MSAAVGRSSARPSPEKPITIVALRARANIPRVRPADRHSDPVSPNWPASRSAWRFWINAMRHHPKDIRAAHQIDNRFPRSVDHPRRRTLPDDARPPALRAYPRFPRATKPTRAEATVSLLWRPRSSAGRGRLAEHRRRDCHNDPCYLEYCKVLDTSAALIARAW